MGSLTAHFLEPGDHGRLRFHPSCPVCRQERLYGTLSSEPVVSRRAQALLAGGVLAISTSAPAVAVGPETDRQFEGVAAPEEPGVEALDDPSFDPGGDTALSFDTAPAPTASEDGEDSGDGAPLDVEPTVDLDARVAPLTETDAPVTDTGAPPSEEASGVPPVDTVPPVTPEAPPSPAVELPGQVGEQVTSPRLNRRHPRENVRSRARPPASPRQDDEGAGASPQGHRTLTPAPPQARSAPSPPPPIPAAGPPPAPATASPSAPSTPATEPVATTEVTVASGAGRQNALDSRNRFYVVQPGDSLWSIAKRLLGSNASPAGIAREVNRLWSLNRDRIATGDPDLLMVGTRLDLR
jgi:LysM domain